MIGSLVGKCLVVFQTQRHEFSTQNPQKNGECDVNVWNTGDGEHRWFLGAH